MGLYLVIGLLIVLIGWAGGTSSAMPAGSVEPAVAQAADTPPAAGPTRTAMVPMRDGTRLATDIWLPAAQGAGISTRRWPVALERTPFGKSNSKGDRYTENGIVFAAQDVRGRSASEGQARLGVDDAWGKNQDGAETVAWIRRQPWCNGKIATVGMPLTQLLLAGTGAKGVVGQCPGVAPISFYHHLFYQNGVFRQSWENWLRDTWPPDVLPLIRRHSSYDAFWRGLDLRTRLDRARWPMVHVAGWFDIFSQGTLDAFTELQERGGTGARGRQHLVVGPWTHFEVAGGSFSPREGELVFPDNAGYPPMAPDWFQWVLFWLKGQPRAPEAEPAVRYYVMGDTADPNAPGNTWRAADRWPPPSRPLRLYLTQEGDLAPQAPAAASIREYDYDPRHPIPTIGGQEAFSPGGPRDQRPVEGRADVLVFSTPPLEAPLEVTGRLRVRLHAATSAQDTDFTTKLTDVYPDGRSMLLADGIVRARYRQTLARAAPIVPGRWYPYDIDLWSTSNIFNRGHRIRVTISSSNAPRFEPNHNRWPPDGNAPPVTAHQRIGLGGSRASYLVLPTPLGRKTFASSRNPP